MGLSLIIKTSMELKPINDSSCIYLSILPEMYLSGFVSLSLHPLLIWSSPQEVALSVSVRPVSDDLGLPDIVSEPHLAERIEIKQEDEHIALI